MDMGAYKVYINA